MSQKLERTGRLVSILQDRNGASIRELAWELDVSEMTIRRDLAQLRLDNVVSLVHGAAIFKSPRNGDPQEEDYHLSLEKTVSNQEKERIGREAARMVEPGDTIIVDIGTTTEFMAKYIPPVHPVTVLCFTMNALLELHKKKVETLIMGGGYYHPNTQLFESEEALALIQRTRATKYFLSAAGVSRELGLTCANQYEVHVKQSCLASSLKKILLADSKKFDQIRSAYFASLDAVDTVITDSGINPDWVHFMEDMSIRVIVV
ncbi:MAG: DeoR/GlpR family DNA-binding transcription regulator [Treponema sp.]|jgi:DeoR family deoxyribose operon repressor|nr:DeoR/GlpR family DNA-binding transcription regulator [Treponema sp.]